MRLRQIDTDAQPNINCSHRLPLGKFDGWRSNLRPGRAGSDAIAHLAMDFVYNVLPAGYGHSNVDNLEIVHIVSGRYAKVAGGRCGDLWEAVELRDTGFESKDKSIAVVVLYALGAGIPSDKLSDK